MGGASPASIGEGAQHREKTHPAAAIHYCCCRRPIQAGERQGTGSASGRQKTRRRRSILDTVVGSLQIDPPCRSRKHDRLEAAADRRQARCEHGCLGYQGIIRLIPISAHP
jgi:hypothetical protein